MKTLLVLSVTALSGLAGWGIAGYWQVDNVRTKAADLPVVAEVSEASVSKEASLPMQSAFESTAYSRQGAMAKLFSQTEKDSQSLERMIGAFRILQDLDSSEFAQAIAQARLVKTPSEIAPLIASLWAERDPQAAAAWLLKAAPRNSIMGGFHEAILETWGRADPTAMFDWVNAHVGDIPAKNRDEFAFGFAKAAVKIDPQRGRSLIEKIAPNRVDSFYMHWVAYAPAAAAAAVLQEPNEQQRNESMLSVATYWKGARRDPSEAAAWAQTIPDPIMADRAMVRIGATVSFRDKRAGAEFMAKLPQTNETRTMLRSIIGDWSEEDLPAAVQWTADLEDDSLGRWAIGQFSKKAKADEVEKVLKSLSPEQQARVQQRRTRGELPPKREIPAPIK
jgi:TPR repeat protein